MCEYTWVREVGISGTVTHLLERMEGGIKDGIEDEYQVGIENGIEDGIEDSIENGIEDGIEFIQYAWTRVGILWTRGKVEPEWNSWD